MTERMRLVLLKPTVFFVREDEALRHLVEVTVENLGDAVETRLEIYRGDVAEALPLGMVDSGTGTYQAWFPDLRSPVELRARLWADGGYRAETTVEWEPQKHWEVHLIQYAHHDLGYTDLPSNVLEEYDGFMDQVLRYCGETEDWPEEDARFRYLCEQTWSVVHYVKNRPPEVIERLGHYLRSGQIELTALFGNQTLELCGPEELIRLMYPSFRLARAFGVDIVSAEHNDIPGFNWGLASVLAGAGVRYFSPGVPIWYFGRGEDKVHPLWDTEEALPLGIPSACWWEGPDRARVLLWSDLHGGEWQPYNYDQAVSELPGILAGLDDRGYPYDMVSYTLRGGHRDNAPPTIRYSYLVREWNRRWAYPRLINTTNRPFLEAFEQRWGHTLKTLRGDVPGTDYSVAATGTPKETAVDRTAHDWLMAGEALATLAARLAGHDYPRTRLDQAYREAFYYDLHCWGLSHIGGPAQDAHWSEKGDRAYRSAALAHDVMVKAANKLADEISYPDEGYYITVFNPLGHGRTDVVRAEMRAWGACASPMYWREPDEAHPWPVWVSGRGPNRRMIDPPAALLDQPFELLDAETGRSVAYQIVTITDPQAAQPWAPERVALGQVKGQEAHKKSLVFVAQDLPPMGYRTYRLKSCEAWPQFARQGTATDEWLENEHYRLTVNPDTGLVSSVYDKALDRELVDGNAPHSFGQLIVRSCATGEEELAKVTEISLVESGPVLCTLRLRAEASCCPRITEEITLYSGVKRVDFNARLLRDSTPMLELFYAFPFAVEEPSFRFEAGDAVIEPIRDQWPGSNTDYYAVQHWADVFNDEWGVAWIALDTPMAEFGGLWPGYVSEAHHGVRGPGYGHEFLQAGELTRAHVYGLVSYNNFRTNFVNAHADEFVVRYSLGAHAGDWREGQPWRLGWNVSSPPLAVWMEGPQPGGRLPLSAWFCQVDAPNVVVLALKQAEDGRGLVLRLWEIAGLETTTMVRLPHLAPMHAFQTDLVETDQRLLAYPGEGLEVTLQPFSVVTLRLITADETAGV